MDSFLSSISTTDTKDRLTLGAQLLEYLANDSNSVVCSDIGFFVDALILWLQSSNFKIVQLDLDIIAELIRRMGLDFQPYTSALLPHLVDKLGDSKEVIREKTSLLFHRLIEYRILTSQTLFDRIALSCFTHKNSNAREQILLLLVETLNSFGPSALSISKLVPHIVKLLGDPNASVRQTATETICELYKHVGNKLKVDLQKKYSVPPNRLAALMAKLDEIKINDCGTPFRSINVNGDETDRACPTPKTQYRPPATPSSVSASYSKKSLPTAPAGAVNEDMFLNSFEDVPKINIYSGHDVEENLRKCEIMEKTNEDWKKRVHALKSVRSLIVAGGLDYEEFYINVMNLLPAFEVALKDLRSQVVREACITVAYLSKNFTSKFDRFGETVLPILINLIQNSAKVVASSGLVCVLIVLQYTHTPRFIPIVADGLKSKSKDIRRACCKFINVILQTWPVTILDKQATVIQEVIKKGIADADPEARIHSRNSYADFSVYFPELAESLKNSLDQTSRKKLFSNSQSGSNSSLSKIECKTSLSTTIARPQVSPGCRSTSAIDLHAAKKAKARAVERSKFIAIPSRKPVADQRQSRPPSRTSISQPTSRSGSPSKTNRSVEDTPRSRRGSTDSTSKNDSINRPYPTFKSMLPVRKSPSAQKSQNELPIATNGSHVKCEEHDSMSYDSGISQMSSGEQIDLPDCQKDCEMLKYYIEELPNANDEKKKELLENIKKLVKEGPPEMIVTNFKSLLGRIIAFITGSESPSVKETTLTVLQTIVKRKTVSFLLKEFSELIIIRVIKVCVDDCKEVSKTAESCALTLSVHLPSDVVIRVVVPLVTSESTTVKLVSLKMLTRVIECADDAPTSEYIDMIMPVLLAAYDDPESIIRKAAVFCIVALHKHSEETKSAIQPYINKLQKPKQKLLDLYIRRAEHGSSMPTSPKCG